MNTENKITNDTTYSDVIDLLNSFEDVDGMLLDFLENSKPEIKIISGQQEISYDYDKFLEIFDKDGLEGF